MKNYIVKCPDRTRQVNMILDYFQSNNKNIEISTYPLLDTNLFDMQHIISTVKEDFKDEKKTNFCPIRHYKK